MTHQDRPVRTYRDLAAVLRDQITTGALPPGHALPPERHLSQQHELGRGAVADAIAQLRLEGLVVTRRGYAAVVAGPYQREALPIDAGCTVTCRMPTLPEREALGIGDGEVVPVLQVMRPDGSGDLYRADRYKVCVQ